MASPDTECRSMHLTRNVGRSGNANEEELLARQKRAVDLFLGPPRARQEHALGRVRNFEARNNLRAMKKSDLVLFYHSGDGKEIVGIAKVVAEAYADPSAKEGDWSVVDLAAEKALAHPVSLAALKQDKALSQMAVVRKPRISVVPVLPDELGRILELAATKL